MPIWGWVCTGLTVFAIVVIVLANIWDRKRRGHALEHGEHTHGWLVQANQTLFEPGHIDKPALVIISPDRATNDDEDFMTDLAERIMALKEVGSIIGDTKAERKVSKLMSDEMYIEGKRDKLPEEFTDGREVYLVHIFIYRDHLPEKRLEGQKIPCAIVWDDEKSMVCTRPVSRKKSKRRNNDDEE